MDKVQAAIKSIVLSFLGRTYYIGNMDELNSWRIEMTRSFPEGVKDILGIYKRSRKIFLNIIILFFILTGVCNADIGIYCPKCHKHLYDYKKDDIHLPPQGSLDNGLRAKDFVPTDISIPIPVENTRFICPFDDAPLNGWEYWFWERGRDLPKMVYPAVTVMIKDKDGNLVWYPDDVDTLIEDR